MKKNLLALQIHSEILNFEANCAKVSAFLEFFYSNLHSLNSSRGQTDTVPDILFLPEVWTVGWNCETFPEGAKANGGALEFLSGLAKKYNVNIIGGSYLRETSEGIKNTCPLINRKGEVFGMFDKIHLYSPDGEAKSVISGDTPVIADVEGLLIGLSICYDIRFPELFRSYIATENPVHLMVNLSAWPKTRRVQYDAMAKSRAVENQCYFLALSQTGLIKDGIYNNGHSLLVDPLGAAIQTLDEDENFIYQTIDTKVVQNVRATFPNLSNRKIETFGFNPVVMRSLV